ncbi:hypothetical protein [Glaciecola sp. 1036]|uniref:hypothetical protein n=1 Tax=Alteromonadaceae TaxID=72275 RepID=UPI003D051FF4
MTEYTLDSKAVANTNLDPVHIYNQGIERLIALSRDVWSDYNKHDPGITFWEVLSYLTTELAYKTDWSVSDILVDGIEHADISGKQHLLNQHFPAPDVILPSAPLTQADYRKLIVDIPNVNNAWLIPTTVNLFYDSLDESVTLSTRSGKTITEIKVAGGYQVKILLAEGLNKAEKEQVLSEVANKLAANRNLCEWFYPPELVAKQGFILCGDIEIEENADPVQVSADIWFSVQQHLLQPIQHQTPSETVDKLDWSESLFNGPLLEHGYISDQDIANSALKTHIRLSDIINIIMDLPGVVAVKELIINPEGTTEPLENIWVIPVQPDKQALLKPQQGNLAFYKRELPTFYDKSIALTEYRKLLKNLQDASQQGVDYSLDAPLSENREIIDYHSVQWDLPAVYGLSEAGLGANATKLRKAQVLQLRGFLSFFDQLAANFLAQTHHIKDLLSLDKDQVNSYFTQIPQSIEDWQKLYGTESQALSNLQQLVQNIDIDLERRNRFMDFMVARFGEDMTGLTAIMLNAFEPSWQKTLSYKIDFYNALPEVSKNRSLGHNLSLKQEVWNTDNVSGLAKRLCRLLGISNHSRRNLSDIAFDIYAEIDTTPDDEFRFRIRNKIDDKILLSSSTNYLTKNDAKKEMRIAIKLGMEAQNYVIAKTVDNRYYFNIVDDTQEVVARRIEYFRTLRDCRRAIRQVIDYLTINYSDEGMYIFEHWWLLPDSDQDSTLPVCLDQSCTECVDPFSYQIHIILPGYGKRLGNMDFRRYCEGVIRSEVPAHIMPKICWIAKDQMALLERAYKDWLSVFQGTAKANASKKKLALLEALKQLHNIYPVENLHDCDSDETGFVIGRTALGTLKEST